MINTSVGEADPARDYVVADEASTIWMLALDELRTSTIDHSQQGSSTIYSGLIWMYGLAPAPDYLQPLSTDPINIFDGQVQEILIAVMDFLTSRLFPKAG